MNKKKIGIIIGIVVLIVGFMYYKKFDDNPYHSFKNVSFPFVSLDNEYYLYVYQSHNEACEKIEDLVIDFADKHNVMFMSGNEKDGNVTLFDWKSFHEKNDIEVGVVNDVGEIVYNEGQNAQMYLNSSEVNDAGKIKEYEIVVADEAYLKENSKAKLGYVYAKLLTANINDNFSSILRKINILDIPALFYINSDDDKQESYYGTEAIKEYINGLMK